MGRSIAKNLIYNLILQIVTSVLPLITLPYVSRILGAEGIGIYSYTFSITQYFIIVGTLGLTMYGNRQIAYMRDDKEKMSRTFWSILSLKIITSGIAILLYLLIFTNTKEYRVVYLIQSINIVAVIFDISWLYMGLEDFKKTVTRNITVKIIGVCLIFIFIKSRNDLNLYILINVIVALLGNIVMWMYLPKTVSMVRLKINDIMIHLVPSIKLFIPQIAIQVYVVLDKTMIGILSNVGEVGYYEQSEKIVKGLMGLVTVLGTVMLPRMSNIFANGDKDRMDIYLNNSLKGVAYVSIPLSIGIAGVSKEFAPIFFGQGNEAIIYLLIWLSPILFFISMSNVMGMQYLLPANRTREFTISVIIGAIINLVLNFILIPDFKALGACIATMLAELSVTIYQYYCLRKEIVIKEYLIGFVRYLFAASIMLVIVRTIGSVLGASVITILVQCLAGMVVYLLTLTILREKVNKLVFLMIIRRISKKNRLQI